MAQWILSDDSIQALLSLPESGMGFQLVSAQWHGERDSFIVLNGGVAFELSQAALVGSIDPTATLVNGIRVINAMKQAGTLVMAGRPEPHSFRLLESRISGIAAAALPTAPSAPQTVQPSSLVKNTVLFGNRMFYRYSAFNPDRRVDPTTGNFLAGTYAAPESEVAFIPTGFAAVGRLALPNLQPASHRYVIEAPPGTAVAFGTVAPAFGQAGGGVEVLLPNGATNQQTPPTPPSHIPDE
jgi:hypothetical protein